ncbi:hypothetical protein C8K30_1011008 [Promicromonospora sp. AC04]|uniref:hypothetical protein n=1 Tax=Promicromonospora sp. AC04 TaxID=2135723 RepID=UPI000D374BA1|nr:hypothetical protein [Promicromonospora sp. AC04]PUB32482.1 hypothetical protein C8K30_1011008 [Promicromonospora sp. AC04]
MGNNSTLNATSPPRAPAAKPAARKRGQALPALLRRLAAKRHHRGTLPLAVWAGLLRAVALAADYLIAFITAVVVVPTLGAWLHAQSGASQGTLTGAGTLAMWLVPFLFLVALLAAGEIALMREIWRWSTRTIGRVRSARAEGNPAASKPTGTPDRRSNKIPTRST